MATWKPLILKDGVPTALPAGDDIGLQPLDALLTAFAGLTPTADQLAYFTGASTIGVATLSSFSRTQLANADAATWRTNLAVAPLASPTFTGIPAAPTATDGTFTTQLATTAFVQNAVGGYLGVAVTGGTYTLTDVEASNPVLAFTGTLTANQIVVLPTTVKRLWAVSNNTTGAFTLTVKTAAGTGVTVAQGKRNLVYTDGTNVYDGFNDFEDIVLTGAPTAPTAAVGVNSVQVATTAYVVSRISNDAVLKAGGSIIGDGADANTVLLSFYKNSATTTIASATSANSYAVNATAGTTVIRNTGDGTTPKPIIVAGSEVHLGVSTTTAANYPSVLIVTPTSVSVSIRPTFAGNVAYDEGNLTPANPPTQLTGATLTNGNNSFWLEEDDSTGEGCMIPNGGIGGIATDYNKVVNLYAKDSNGNKFYIPMLRV